MSSEKNLETDLNSLKVIHVLFSVGIILGYLKQSNRISMVIHFRMELPVFDDSAFFP